MPIYEFKCLDCENEFESLMLRSADKAKCKKCGSENVQRMMSAFSSPSLNKHSSSGSCGCSSCSTHNCSTCR